MTDSISPEDYKELFVESCDLIVDAYRNFANVIKKADLIEGGITEEIEGLLLVKMIKLQKEANSAFDGV